MENMKKSSKRRHWKNSRRWKNKTEQGRTQMLNRTCIMKHTNRPGRNSGSTIANMRELPMYKRERADHGTILGQHECFFLSTMLARLSLSLHSSTVIEDLPMLTTVVVIVRIDLRGHIVTSSRYERSISWGDKDANLCLD